MHRGEAWEECHPDVQARWLAAADVALVAEHAAYLRGFAEARDRAVKLLDPQNPQEDWTEYAHDCHRHAEYIRAMKPKGEA